MLVEFFGLPGAGKSSLSRFVAEILSRQELTADEFTYDIDHRHRRLTRALYKVMRAMRYAGANPGRAISIGAKIASTEQTSRSDFAKQVINWAFLASLGSRKRAGGSIMLLDQGFAQALWSTGFAARNESWLDVVLDMLDGFTPAPDLVVYVRADLRTIRARLAQRRPRVSRLERELGTSDLPLIWAEARCEAVASRLGSRGVAIVDVGNDDPEQREIGARRVAAEISSILHRSAGQAAQPGSAVLHSGRGKPAKWPVEHRPTAASGRM